MLLSPSFVDVPLSPVQSNVLANVPPLFRLRFSSCTIQRCSQCLVETSFLPSIPGPAASCCQCCTARRWNNDPPQIQCVARHQHPRSVLLCRCLPGLWSNTNNTNNTNRTPKEHCQTMITPLNPPRNHHYKKHVSLTYPSWFESMFPPLLNWSFPKYHRCCKWNRSNLCAKCNQRRWPRPWRIKNCVGFHRSRAPNWQWWWTVTKNKKKQSVKPPCIVGSTSLRSHDG